MDCGCRIADIRTFADHMKTQRGWNVATTAGWGGGGDRQYVRVRPDPDPAQLPDETTTDTMLIGRINQLEPGNNRPVRNSVCFLTVALGWEPDLDIRNQMSSES